MQAHVRVKAAITLMHDLEALYKNFVLGDMLELGRSEKEFHKEVESLFKQKKLIMF